MTQLALYNHLWQSTLFALAAAALAWALRHHQARVRFGIWMAASLKFLLPFRWLAGLGSAVSQYFRWPSAPAAAVPGLAALGQPFQQWAVMASPAATRADSANWLWLAGLVWATGSAVLAMRWGLRWRQLARLARAAEPGAVAGLEIRSTPAAVEPGVFGIVRPVLLLPAGLGERLSPGQMAAVIAHERCHMRRRDNLWSALHMLVETVFWFHPLAWWIGGRLVAERERACDESVLRQGSDAHTYASGIVQVCRHYMESPLACAAGIGGGALKQRVAAILEGGWGRSLGRSRALVLAGLAALALAGPLAVGIVFAQTTPPLPTSFDAASIKPAALPSSGGEKMLFRKGMEVQPTRLVGSNMSLKELLETAYHLQSYQVVGPDWINSQLFDVNAETAVAMPRDKMVELLQPFLEQQFKLQTHRETKTVPIYAMTVTDETKLKPASPDGFTPDMPELPAAGRGMMEAAGRNNVARPRALPPGAFMMMFNGESFTLAGNSDVSHLCTTLARQLDRPVVDMTGLQGNYAIQLTYAPPPGAFGGLGGMKMMAARRADAPPPPAEGASGGDNSTNATAPVPSLFTAIQQLGLKLDARKGPVELLVVDKGEKVPVGN